MSGWSRSCDKRRFVPEQLQVSCSPASLRSIVYNLLSNAFMHRRPRLAQADAVVLTAQDNGLGLSKVRQRLFGLLQRLHAQVEGPGVELYTIKRLIDNAGARISVVRQPDQGATFTVMFPA